MLGVNHHTRRCPMELYGGLDVHSSNTRIGVVEGDGRRVYERRVANDPKEILRELHPMSADMVGLVVESTYNWYWLVEALMDGGYTVHLANPSAMKMYEGRKYTDDRHDAFWLADLLADSQSAWHHSEKLRGEGQWVGHEGTQGGSGQPSSWSSCLRKCLFRYMAGVVNRKGVGNQPSDLIGNPPRPRHRVISIFAAHAVSQGWLVMNHMICNIRLDTAWYRGSSDLQKAERAGSGISTAGPDPDG
jgi:hypothetical protein